MSESVQPRTHTLLHRRLESIDILRGLAVLLMLYYHFVRWLMRGSERTSVLAIGNIPLTDLAPIIFFMVTGLTLFISVSRRRAKGVPRREITRHIVKRYLLLMVGGLLLDLVVWGPAHLAFWDVLEAIGLTNILAYLIIAYWTESTPVLLAIGGLGYLSVFVLEGILPGWTPGIFKNMLVGTFPIGPYLMYVLVGIVIGQALVRSAASGRERTFAGIAFGISAGALLLGLALQKMGFTLERYPPVASFVLFTLGGTISLFALFFWLKELRPAPPRWLNPLKLFGERAIYIYVGHLAVRNLSQHLGFWQQLSFKTTNLAAVGLLALIFFILYSQRNWSKSLALVAGTGSHRRRR